MRSSARPLFLAVLSLGIVSSASAQDKTQPPAGARALLTLQAAGSQVYVCQRTGNNFQWTFVAPAARLFDADHNEVATHADGPVWNYQDGSSIHGVVQSTSPSPDAGSIPWLLLKAVNPERSGLLSTVDFIRRSDTHGGVAPVGGCDAGHEGDLARSPYTATYTFYSVKP